MQKNLNHVLIIEDDIHQCKAFYEAFKRAGYRTTLCSSAGEALTQVQRIEFQLLIVDCLLPKMNGIDVVEQITAKMANKPEVIFVSGVFKSRNFIRETMDRTQAKAFFTKPVDLGDLLSRAQEVLDERDNQAPPILKLYSSSDEHEIVRWIESQPTIHAFHLPKLFQRMMETSTRGELTITHDSGEASSIQFYRGQIFSVKPPERASYFGRLAVRHRFAEPKDISEALQNPKSKTLGEKLIESMAMSPHAVRVIVTEQLEMRLAQTIRDNFVTLNWENHDYPKPEIGLEANRLEALIDDWIDSKITTDWIRSIFILWGSFKIQGDYHSRIQGPHTIESIFTDPSFNEKSALPKMFRSLLKGSSFMGGRGNQSHDYSLIESRVDQLTSDFETRNYYQILGVSETAHRHEINKAIRHLKEAFDPSQLPDDCPASLIEKCTVVLNQIERVRETLSNDRERKKYLDSVQSNRVQEKFEAEPQFRAAVRDLLKGNHHEAATKLESLIDRRLPFRDLQSYYLWASIKCNRTCGKPHFDRVPSDERNSPAYMMAKGLYFRSKGRFREAIECFRTAHFLNPRLKMANREFESLITELEQNRRFRR